MKGMERKKEDQVWTEILSKSKILNGAKFNVRISRTKLCKSNVCDRP